MDQLSKKYYGLKAWQWILVLGGGAFVYFRMRSGGGVGATTATDTSGNTDPTAGAQGFGQGYTQGYGTGLYQGSIAPTPNPPAGSKNCRPMKDPSGKSHTVCGPGAWQNLSLPGGPPAWRWVEGATKTIYGKGKGGNFFYKPIQAHKPRKNTQPRSAHGPSVPPAKTQQPH